VTALAFGRRVQVLAGPPGSPGVRIDSAPSLGSPGLRVAVRGRRTIGRDSDAMDITVWGLGDADIGPIRSPGAVTVVRAGHRETIGQIGAGPILAGTLTDSRIEEPGSPERWIRWSITDAANTLGDAMVARSYADGVSAERVIRDIAADAGLVVGVLRLGRAATYPGLTAWGTASEWIGQVARDTGSAWSVQDGRVEVWPAGSERRLTAVQIRPDIIIGGIRDVTDRDARGRVVGRQAIEVQTILIPAARPGDPAIVTTGPYAGRWVVSEMDLDVDSGYSTEFYTRFRLEQPA